MDRQMKRMATTHKGGHCTLKQNINGKKKAIKKNENNYLQLKLRYEMRAYIRIT